MQRTNALQRLLRNLTRVFHDDYVDVEFTSGPSSAAADGSHVKICTNLRDQYGLRDVSEAEELRVMVDHLSHEIEHIRESRLTGKQEFVDEYRENHPEYAQLAGYVINVLEDVFIDGTRTRRFPGLKQSHAYFIDTQMRSADHVGASLSKERRLTSGFWEVSHAGYARGIEKAEPEVREALARCRVIAQQTRKARTPEERTQLAHEAMRVLIDAMPDKPDVNEIDDGVARAPVDPDDIPEPTEPPEAPEGGDTQDVDDDGSGDGQDGEGSGDSSGDDSDDDDGGSGRGLDDLLGDVDPSTAKVVEV